MGEIDKYFAMVMKIHHQQVLDLAELKPKTGKSPEMKSRAIRSRATQKK